MKKAFTKSELQTGDIIETRNGERGVVILEKDCILYQEGGFDMLCIFTEDLFVDGPQREGDIFKVYRDIDEDPLGFKMLLGNEPIFRRRNGKETKKRTAELDDKYDEKKGKARVICLEPCFRKCHETLINKSLESDDADMVLSMAPSMTVLGQLKIERKFIPIPDTENLFILYNPAQEEWHLRHIREEKAWLNSKAANPIVVFAEENISIYSRCIIIRKNASGELEDLSIDDFEKVKRYLMWMQMIA